MHKLRLSKLLPPPDGAPFALLPSLELSVMMRVESLPSHIDWDRIKAIAPQLADTIASKGDVLMFRGKKKGETAHAFNALAEALVFLALAPGGVVFMGLRWEVIREKDPSPLP